MNHIVIVVTTYCEGTKGKMHITESSSHCVPIWSLVPIEKHNMTEHCHAYLHLEDI